VNDLHSKEYLHSSPSIVKIVQAKKKMKWIEDRMCHVQDEKDVDKAF
jgi:hypothetical protein